jgi:hypothetical protein
MRLASIEELLGRLPQAASVTFDRWAGMILQVGSITINIPGGAIPADTDQITLDVFPLSMVPEQRFEEVLGYSYALAAYDANGVPIDERFYENVALTMSYSETLLPPGTDEEDILPAYLSTTDGRWTAPESYILDTAHDEITLYIDHFTKFGTVSTPFIDFVVHLPITLSSFGP